MCELENDSEASGIFFIDTQSLQNYLSYERGRNSMVECQLPKLKVASSSLVARSK